MHPDPQTRQSGLNKGEQMKYRKKPIVVDAWQWLGKSAMDAKFFCNQRNLPQFHTGARNGIAGLIIPTLEGDMVAQCGDWIIKGVNGEYYPCKPDIFAKTYEKEMGDVFEIRIPNLQPDEVQYARKAINNFAKELLNKLQKRRTQKKNMN